MFCRGRIAITTWREHRNGWRLCHIDHVSNTKLIQFVCTQCCRTKTKKKPLIDLSRWFQEVNLKIRNLRISEKNTWINFIGRFRRQSEPCQTISYVLEFGHATRRKEMRTPTCRRHDDQLESYLLQQLTFTIYGRKFGSECAGTDSNPGGKEETESLEISLRSSTHGSTIKILTNEWLVGCRVIVVR